MDEKSIIKKKTFAGEKKVSMKRRDDYNDYRGRRIYMITIEVENRRPLFGKIVGNVSAPDGSPDAPRLLPTPLGKAVEEEWFGISRYYKEIEVMCLQLMPDHLHGILFVHETLPVHLNQVIIGFKTGCNRILRAQSVVTQPQPTPNVPPQAGSQSLSVPPQAAAASQQKTGIHLFAPNYNDLLLKNYDEFQRWKRYLRNNPRRLLMKRQHPDLLRPFFRWQIGSWTYNGIGNRHLLGASWRQNVRISRRLSPEQLEAEVARYIADAQADCVLISPAISPGEKRVMRTVFNMGLPTVAVLRNGFTPLTKPHGEQFNACSAGRLLMLSVWPHSNERVTLTAYDCQQMNLQAQELSRLDIDTTTPLLTEP